MTSQMKLCPVHLTHKYIKLHMLILLNVDERHYLLISVAGLVNRFTVRSFDWSPGRTANSSVRVLDDKQTLS